MNKRLFSSATLALAVGCTSSVGFAQSTIFESNDVLSPAEALGRFQWLEKCYEGLLLEVADQMFDPTNPIPKDQKLANLRNAFLYKNGKLKSDAKYLTFGDEERENPKRWFAGTSPTQSCRQIPSDYVVSALMVTPNLPKYCNVQSRDKDYEYIKQVKISDLDNSSGTSYFSNYIGQAAKVYLDESYTLELTPGFIEAETYPETWHVFVDWNRDGDFNDNSEKYYGGASENTVEVELNPPGHATPGLTKMRVTMDYVGGSSDACKEISSGEIEDYLLNLK